MLGIWKSKCKFYIVESKKNMKGVKLKDGKVLAGKERLTDKELGQLEQH